MIKGNIQVLGVQIQKVGVYLVVTIKPGLLLMWDQKTSLFISLSPSFQVKPTTYAELSFESIRFNFGSFQVESQIKETS